MPPRWVAESAREDRTGTVAANGTLTIRVGPRRDQVWEISQISLEMPTAPAGATAEIRDVMGALMSPSYSARRASASGSQYLNPGETIAVTWQACTPGDVGRVWALYRKGLV
jgi:hypothetical protein